MRTKRRVSRDSTVPESLKLELETGEKNMILQYAAIAEISDEDTDDSKRTDIT